MPLTSRDATLDFDPVGATLRSLDVIGSPHPLLISDEPIFDLALPLPDDLPHRVRPAEPTGDQYPTLRSPRGDFPIACRLTVRPDATGGFALRLVVENNSSYRIPQVVFPRLTGLRPTGRIDHETLHLGRSVKWPYTSTHTPDGAAAFLGLYRRWYVVYGMHEWNLKWFRLGNDARGLAVYSRELDTPLQGLSIEREAGANRLSIGWAHYPHVEPGATWTSPEIVLFPHNGNWQFGAEPYRAHVAAKLPTVPTTRYLKNSLGVRSLFYSTYLYDDNPNFTFSELPIVAKDALAHGIRELNVWFAFESYFELPMKLNPKLGTREDLVAALAACRTLGVNVAAFVSVRSLKANTAPPEWFEVDDRGNRRTQQYSYSLGFVPVFNPPYCNRDESAYVCPAVPGYRNAFIAACRDLHALGFSSVSYDQLFADRLCYGQAHGHRPQDLARALTSLLRDVHKEGQAVDPDASLSGEFFNDVTQTFQHYNWDWVTGAVPLAEHEAFRYVFPRYRMGLLVDRGRRWLLEGFCRGFLLNLVPDGGEGLIGSDAAFSDLTKRLAAARNTYARFFETGEYFGTEEVPHAPGVISSLYRAGREWLMILANVHADSATVEGHTRHPVSTQAVPRVTMPPLSFAFFRWPDGAENWALV